MVHFCLYFVPFVLITDQRALLEAERRTVVKLSKNGCHGLETEDNAGGETRNTQ